jgi:hypothetical protein
MPLNTAGNGSPSFTANPTYAPDDANGMPGGVPGAPPNLYQGPNGGGDPLSNAIQAEQAANPQLVSVNTPTKLGKLLNIAVPILEGGMVGALGGKSHPGGGFAFAQEFYAQRRQQQMQQAMLQQTAQNNQFKNALDAAKTQHEINQPGMTRTNPPIKVADGDPNSPTYGQRFYFAQDANTGKWARIPGGAVPDDDPGQHFTMTNKGLIAEDPKRGTAKLVTLGGSDGDSDTSAGGSPLMPPGFDSPKPSRVSNRNASGTETDNLIDENPNSPTFGQPLKKAIASRAPLPDRAGARANDRATQVGQIEDAAGFALDNADGDPDDAIDLVNKSDMASSKKALVRQRIRERARRVDPPDSLDDVLSSSTPPSKPKH